MTTLQHKPYFIKVWGDQKYPKIDHRGLLMALETRNIYLDKPNRTFFI